jgi:hypothetical protein
MERLTLSTAFHQHCSTSSANHFEIAENQVTLSRLCNRMGMATFPDLRQELLKRYGATPDDFCPFEENERVKDLLESARRSRWLQAEANAVLARNASAEDYRAFVLGSVPQSSNSRELQRIPWIAVEATLGDDVFQRIIAEISVARPLASEPVDEAILERLGSPEEAESRFFLGREGPFYFGLRPSPLTQSERC